MGRKNKRVQSSPDSNFVKFMDSVNKTKKPDTSPKRNKHNDVSKFEKQRSNPVKTHHTFSTIEERNRERVRYASERFKQLNIPYHILNEDRGVLSVQNHDGNDFIYYASIGKLKDVENVIGLKQVIRFLNP